MNRSCGGYRGVLVVFALLVLLGGFGPATVRAAVVTYAPGWHLVAGPPGTVFQGIAALDALDPATEQYVSLPLDQPTQAGSGYFAFFTDTFVVRMAPDDHAPVQVSLAPNSWTLVGNPSAYSVAVVAGADVVYDFDQQGGYLIESSVPPGAGALVYSRAGGTATIQPVAAGIEAQVADLSDTLIGTALTAGDMPAGFHLTRAEASGAQNINIPATYIEEFRPRQAPQPAAAGQTALVQVNLQQAKDAGYATTLLDGTTSQTIQNLFGSNAQAVTSVTAPDVGDAAKQFQFVLQNGNTQLDAALIAFRRKQVYVTVVVVAPAGHGDTALLQTLALTQDSRIDAAF